MLTSRRPCTAKRFLRWLVYNDDEMTNKIGVSNRELRSLSLVRAGQWHFDVTLHFKGQAGVSGALESC